MVFQKIVRKVKRLLGKSTDFEIRRTPRIIPASEHKIPPGSVSWQAIKACEALQRNGFKAYVVGGAVRDLLLGVTPKDFDIATNATPEQVKSCQRRAIIIGRRFRLVHVLFGKEIIECATFRSLDTDGVRKDADGRVISDNIFGEMWEDAARRDFSINALYYDPATQNILDYHNGYEDLVARRLRVIGNPEARYREDPVRMMRAVRIAAKLGFTIDEDARRPIPEMASLLRNVPDARLFDEIIKLLTSGHAVACVKELRREGLHEGLLPMLSLMDTASEGEKFMMLALQRTDERINAGKKTSPSFLFATLLWPQTLRRWEYFISKGGKRAQSLFEACKVVLDTQCEKVVIQKRYIEDIQMIWMLQYRFERRIGKSPFALVEHPKFRAAYDFLMLRAHSGQVPLSVLRWWKRFYEATEEERHAIINEAQRSRGRQTEDTEDAKPGETFALRPAPSPVQPEDAGQTEDRPQEGARRGRHRAGRRRTAAGAGAGRRREPRQARVRTEAVHGTP